MLVELETGLVALVRNSLLGKRLRQVDSLPDLDADSLVSKFSTDAPAVYVAMGSFPVRNRLARPKFGVACIAKNSRSQQAARHGDGIQIGLSEMLEAVMTLVDGATVSFDAGQSAASFEVVHCDMINSEALSKNGVYVGVVQVQTTSEVSLPSLLEDLAEFKTFHADFDIDPHQPASEHDKWLQEPQNLSTSAPELSDTVILKE